MGEPMGGCERKKERKKEREREREREREKSKMCWRKNIGVRERSIKYCRCSIVR